MGNGNPKNSSKGEDAGTGFEIESKKRFAIVENDQGILIHENYCQVIVPVTKSVFHNPDTWWNKKSEKKLWNKIKKYFDGENKIRCAQCILQTQSNGFMLIHSPNKDAIKNCIMCW